MTRFYVCPFCERLLVTASDGGPASHDCLNAEIRAHNVRVMHDDGNHHHCDLTSNCRKDN